MIKRKRAIALLSSAVILTNTTSGGINEFKVFAEDNIIPIVKENLLDLTNNSNKQQTNITDAVEQPENSGSLDNPTTTQPDDTQSGGTNGSTNPDDTQSGGTNGSTNPDDTQSGDINGSTNPDDSTQISKPTPLLPSPDFKLSSNSGKEKGGIYYTNKSEIEFGFTELKNVNKINVTVENNAGEWSNSGDFTNIADTATIKLNKLETNKTIKVKIQFVSKDNVSKYSYLTIINDTEAPTVSFEKDEQGATFGDDSSYSNGIYYLTADTTQFSLYIKGNDETIASIAEVKNNGFDVKYTDLNNGYFKFDISSITPNNENTLRIKVKDFVGNVSDYYNFTLFKDTAKAEVKIDSSKLKLHNQIYYIQNHTCTDTCNDNCTEKSNDLVLDVKFEHVENIDDFSKADFIKDNILILDDKDKPINNNETSIILSNIENNKATLTLKNVPINTNFKLQFKKLKDNPKDTVESNFTLYKDTIKPNISLSTDENIVYNKNNILYLKYGVNSTTLTIDVPNNTKSNDKKEDLSFSGVIKDKYGKEIDLTPDIDFTPGTNEKNIVFNINVPNNSTNEVVLTATDYSGNKAELIYTIIQDNNDYSTFKDIMTTKFSGDSFDENNKLYIYNNETTEFAFNFKLHKDALEKHFEIFKIEYENGQVKSKELLNSFEDNVNLSYLVDGNDFTYLLSAKNGTLNEEYNYTVYYTNKYDLSINFSNGDSPIENNALYSDSEGQFNFNATVADAGISNITSVTVDLIYTPFDGRPTKVNTITLNPNSKYLEKGYKNILVGKEIRKAKTYTLSKEFILNKLNFKNDTFKDGTYSIEINVDSKFNYPDEATRQTISFAVYSSAPEATLVLQNVYNNNELITLNENRTYIHANDIYIAIKKEKFNILDYNEKNDKNYKRTININNKDYDFSSLKECKELKDYILYQPKSENDKNALNSLISDNNENFMDYEINISVSDTLKNSPNSTSSNNVYTIDKKPPELNIYSTSNNYNNKIIPLKGTEKNYAPFVNPKDIIAVITNETNDKGNVTLDGSVVKHINKFLWFDKTSTQTNELKINVKDMLKINSEGLYELQVTSTDKAGNETTETFYINVDIEKPEIDLKDIKNKAFAELENLTVDINRKPFSFKSTGDMSVSDTMNSEIFLDLNLTEKVTGEQHNFKASSTDPKFYISSKTVKDGIYKVKLTATDEAGNEAYNDTGEISIDGDKPVVLTILPTLEANEFNEGNYTIKHKNVDSVTPVIKIKDITTKPEDINIVLQGRNSSKTIPVDESNSSVDGYTREITLPNISNEDIYDLQISVGDRIIREKIDTTRDKSLTNIGFGIDRTAPSINMRDIANDKAFADLDVLNVDVNRSPFSFRSLQDMMVSDSIASESQIDLKLNLSDIVTKKSHNFDTSSKSFDISSVEDGIYKVVLTATDEAGNKNSSEGKITIDGSKPDVSTTLSSLKDGNLGEGTHTIEHKNVDSVTPVVTITDITTKPEDINIVLQGRDSSKTISVDNSNSSVDGYTRKITLPSISSEDVYDLKISVGDRIIRESIASRNNSITNIGFAIDRTKPSLSVTAGGKSITEGSTTYLNAKDAKDLVAKVNDNILAENEIKTVITLNGSSKNSTTHTFNSDNTYNVNVTTTDNASNSNSLDFTIIVDTVIPKVTIEGVTEGKFFDKDVTPIITTDDETAVETITLNNQSYTKGTLINKDNDYTLVAKAEDEAGNIGEASVNFVLDKTKPVINIKNIEENVLYTKSTLSSDIKALDYGVEKVIFLDNKTTLIPDIEVSDNDNEVEKVIFLDNKEYTGGPISTDGSHVLTVKAVDRASNTSQATVKFKTNLNPPTITIHGIENNKTYTGPVKLNIEFGDTKLYHILINGKEYMNGDIISKPGKYKMEIIAIDEFNSESRQVINFTINEGVVAPSSVKDSGPTANTYKLVAVGVVTTLSLILFGVFFKVLRPKNISE